MTGALRVFDPTSSIGKFLADPWGPVTASESYVTEWYQFGDGYLGIGCEYDRFLTRFRKVYSECGTEPPARSDVHQHVCLVRRCGTDFVHVAFEDPVQHGASWLDPFGYLDPLLRERGYVEEPLAPQGWRVYRSVNTAARVAFSRTEMVLEQGDRWPWIVANAAVNRVLAMQPQQIFFHGAAIGIGGNGVLILGPAGSGKTTVALALAARGHSFLSDEIAGVRLASRELIPVRRSSFVRSGPAAPEVKRALDAAATSVGGRRCAPVGDLFPDAVASPVTANHLIRLRRFSDATRLEKFIAGYRHLSTLNPLACSMITDRPGHRVMQVLSLISRLECYFLDSASPDGAADAIERLVEE